MTRRTTFLIVNSTIVLLSLLTGLKIIPGPDSVGIALAFYTLVILPGILLSALMFGGTKVDFEGITRIFLTGLSCACLFVCIGFIPGVTYSFIAISYVTAIVIALAYRGIATGKEEEERGVDLVGSFSRREDYSAREKKAMLVVFIFLFGICAALFASNGELGWNTDAPDHISFVRRSLDGGGLLPGDSFYIDGDGATFDPRKGLWHPVVSLWAWLADTPPHVLWTMMPAFLSFFAIVVFWFFAGELSGSIPVKTLSVLFFFLFFRGDGFAWLTKLSYSRNIAHIVFWGTSGFLIRYLRSQKGKDLGIAALAAAAGTAIHISFAPVLGLFLLGLMVYVSILRLGSDWMSRFWKAVPLVSAAVAFPLAVRLINFPDHTNMIHTHMQGMMEIGAGLRMIDPAELIAGMGFPFLFAVLIIPVFPLITSGYRRSRLVWLLFTIPTLLVLIPLTATPLDMAAGYMHYRLIYAAPAMVYMALAVFGAGRGALTGSWKKGGRSAGWKQRTAVHIAGALVFVFFAVVFLKPSAASLPGRLSSALIDSKNRQVDRGEELAEFLSVIPEGSVVAADPVSSYYISAFTDHYVTVVLDQHCSPADTSAIKRIKRARDIFSPGLPDSLILERLTSGRADYLFIDALQGNRDDFFGVLSQESGVRSMIRFGSCGFLKEIRTKGTMKLFAIDSSIPAISKEHAAETDTCSGSLDLPACEEIVLEGFDVETASLSPGDTAVIALCWSSTGETEFGLPFYWTVRFETGFSKGSFYRKWYGKQYRRRVERSRGELYRYTVSGRLAGDGRQPDMWKAGEKIRQEIKVHIPAGMADGEYSLGITLERRTYLPNRRITDYFLNEDSYTGFKAGKVTIRK